MLVRQNRLVLGLLGLWLAGCGDDASTPDDAGPDSGALADAATDADADSAVDEVDPTIPVNFSFDAARHLDFDDGGVLQPLLSADQVDYFSFDTEAGEVYVLMTARGRFSPNNVIALYDPQREKVAENDIGQVWPGDQIDARLVVRARESGRHYLVVEDRELPPEAFNNDEVPTFYYRITLQHLEHGSAAVAWESGDIAAPSSVDFVDDESTGVAYATLIGEISDGETDRFELHGRDAQVLVGHVLPGGLAGNGSTLIDGVVGVRDATEHLVAEIDRALGSQHLHPPLTDADYTLSVRSDGVLGENAFYAIDLVLLPDNPSEQATANDTLEAAQAIELFGGFLRRGTILAELPELDVDYFAFEALANDRVDVRCEGQSAGSGVRALHAEVRDDGDATLGDADEAVDTGLFLTGVTVPADGTYYLRLTSETPASAETAPAWVRCAVIAEP